MHSFLNNVFKGLPVLVTGHTGFKGSWLSIWLSELGARVIGYSLDPPTVPSHFEASHLARRIVDTRGDVRDFGTLCKTLQEHRPQVVFHLAAQPIVRQSYREPKETFDVNVGGTVNVLEAVRSTPSVRAVVCITSDKCYENHEWVWGYRENDRLGGYDPYSASKAMAELAIASYRRSFFSKDQVAVASTRAGNVIGGGDWGIYRLVPDCMRDLMAGQPITLRHPRSVRPWLYVLEPLSGYLWLAVKLLQEDGHEFAEAWNMGPLESQGVTTEEIVKKTIELWGGGSYLAGAFQPEVETGLLRLNWDKAAHRLGWRPVYTWQEALGETVAWYKAFHAQAQSGSIDMHDYGVEQIQTYTRRARELGIEWAG